MAGPYAERARELLADAEEHAARFEWEAVTALATAALALDADSVEARRLLDEASRSARSPGERRQLTVMFCDVVGSTDLSHRHDPEIVREVLRSYQAACDEAVRSYGGRIALYIGDGVLVYFGHPVPHEDDARRAVGAGLELLEALGPVIEEARTSYGIELGIRVAVHTGEVVLAEMGSPLTPDRDAIVGETPNLAARLQDRAAPGTLVISEDTWALVRGYFSAIPLGPQELKGIGRSVAAYEVVEATPAVSRVFAQADLSPFVGRDAELAAVTACWEQAVAGASASVLVRGEPGIGKSRLADVVRRHAEAGGGTTLVAACSSFHTSTPLFPVRRLLEQITGIDRRTEPRQAVARLWDALDAVGQGDALGVFAELLGIQAGHPVAAPELDGTRFREVALTTLVAWVRGAAAAQPLYLVVDDLQWADPTTTELVGWLVVDKPPGLCLVLTARPEFRPPWRLSETVDLGRLDASEVLKMVERLPRTRVLGRDEAALLVRRSDGVPLFVEELLRAGDAPPAPGGGIPARSTVPAALRDLLLARFAAPGVDLRVAQAMATIGQEVPRPLLARVLDLPEAALDTSIEGMLAADLIDLVAGDPPTYRFRHHLLADLAYDTQLQAPRAHLHGVIADALHDPSLSELPVDAATLAEHLERAGRTDQAIEMLITVANQSLGTGAHAEACATLDHALRLVEALAAGTPRDRLELLARLARGLAASATVGYAGPGVVEDFGRCSELCAEIGGHAPELATTVLGLWASLILTARLDDARDVIARAVSWIPPTEPHRILMEAFEGYVAFFRGDYTTTVSELTRLLAVVDSIEISDGYPLLNHPAPTALIHLAFAEGMRGNLSRATELMGETRSRSADLAFPRGPFTGCYAASMEGFLHLQLGEIESARAAYAEVSYLADKHGYQFWAIPAAFGTAAISDQRDADAYVRAEAALMMMRAVGVVVWLPSFHGMLASRMAAAGDHVAARRHVDDALQIVTETGAHLWTAELRRLDGELRLATGDAAGLDVLRSAVDLAAEQGARLLELRARVAVCRHGGDDSDRAACRALLNSFAGEPEIPDLADARALLAGPSAAR